MSTWKFGNLRQREQDLVDPRDAHVAADDDELLEVEQNRLEVRDRPSGLGGAARARVADLVHSGKPGPRTPHRPVRRGGDWAARSQS